MKTYTLYNKRLEKRLTHPRVGLWFTNSLSEADEMLESCHEYLRSSGLGGNEEDFVVIDVESGKEVASISDTSSRGSGEEDKPSEQNNGDHSDLSS